MGAITVKSVMTLRVAGTIALACTVLFLPSAATASRPHGPASGPTVATDSAIFVERHQPGAGRLLEPASALNPGDRVVTVLRWYRLGGDGGFVLTNPVPAAISYQKSSRPDELVSVDGGRSWGRLGDLRIGARMASPEDVTHVRWRIPAGHSAIGKGHLAYSGIVR